MMLRDGSVPCQQEGIFRTNCIDCLDRTNVVQSLLARESLQLQLKVVFLFTFLLAYNHIVLILFIYYNKIVFHFNFYLTNFYFTKSSFKKNFNATLIFNKYYRKKISINNEHKFLSNEIFSKLKF